MRRLRRLQSGVLLQHPILSLAVMLAFVACPVALWYVHTHPVRHAEVCSYRSYDHSTAKGTPSIPVYVPVYCDRPAGG